MKSKKRKAKKVSNKTARKGAAQKKDTRKRVPGKKAKKVASTKKGTRPAPKKPVGGSKPPPSSRPKAAPKVVGKRDIIVVRTTKKLQVTKSNLYRSSGGDLIKKSRRNKDQGDEECIWIQNDNDTDPNPQLETVPYTLDDGDVIWCVDPPDGQDVTYFEVDTDPPNVDDNGNPDPVIDYNTEGGNDEIDVDLSVIDDFAEDYDPNATPAFQDDCVDPPLSIGING
jgi:hypothetical protein